MESVDKKFGDILKQLRIDKGLTQQGLGKELNISKSAISHYEKGDNCPPLSILVTIARYFNVSTDYMLGECNSEFRYNRLSELFYNTTEYGDILSRLKDIPYNDRKFYNELFEKLLNK